MQQISLGDNLGSYSSDDFLPTEMRTDFENLAENVFTSFNLTTITQLLNTTSINEFDLEGISNNLTSLAVYFGSIVRARVFHTYVTLCCIGNSRSCEQNTGNS